MDRGEVGNRAIEHRRKTMGLLVVLVFFGSLIYLGSKVNQGFEAHARKVIVHHLASQGAEVLDLQAAGSGHSAPIPCSNGETVYRAEVTREDLGFTRWFVVVHGYSLFRNPRLSFLEIPIRIDVDDHKVTNKTFQDKLWDPEIDGLS